MMKLDVRSDGHLETAAADAERAERAGFDAMWVAEAGTDPFLPLALAAVDTTRIELGTAVAIAFARSPMTVAQTAWDLNRLSGGRMLLGLGSQIKAHIERRYSMPWSSPAARMREFLLALGAIWSAWATDGHLDFRGTYYQHTLMPPLFRPRRSDFGAPRVFLAAVGPLMTRTAAESADGLRVHGFTTERYLREVTLARVDEGLETSGRGRESFEVSYPVMFATGSTEVELQSSIRATRKQLAFYGSTPAYLPVLDLHGWGGCHERLKALSKLGEWDQMGELINDDMLAAFAAVGTPTEVGATIVERFGNLVDRVSLHQPYGSDPSNDLVAPVESAIRSLTPSDVSAGF